MVWRLELVRSLDCGPSERITVSEVGEIPALTHLDGVGFDLTTSQRVQCDLQRAVVAVQGRALKAKAALMRQVDPTLSLKDYGWRFDADAGCGCIKRGRSGVNRHRCYGRGRRTLNN